MLPKEIKNPNPFNKFLKGFFIDILLNLAGKTTFKQAKEKRMNPHF